MKARKHITIISIVLILLLMTLTGCEREESVKETEDIIETSETLSRETETTSPEVLELTDTELQEYTRNGVLDGIGDWAILTNSDFRLVNGIKYKRDTVDGVTVDDKQIDLTKTGKYEAEAKITFKDGEKTRKMDVEVYDKDEMTERLVEYGIISGTWDYTILENTDVKLEDLIYVDPDIISTIKVDDKTNMKTAGAYAYSVTYSLRTAEAHEFEDRINAEIDAQAKANPNAPKEEYIDLHVPEDCDYVAVTVVFGTEVIDVGAVAKYTSTGTFVITPDTLNDAIAYNKTNAGENAKSASEMAEAETGTEPATTVPESQVPEATTSAQEATTAQPETTTQGSAQAGSNDRPTEPATQTLPAETTIPESTTEFVPSQPQATSHTHDWMAVTHEEPVYGVVHHPAETGQRWVDGDPIYEVHEVCYGCGLDLTAAGYTPDQMADHMDAHALAGEYEAQGNERVQVGTTEGHYENYEISSAWDETVQNGTQTIVDYYYCAICGETK